MTSSVSPVSCAERSACHRSENARIWPIDRESTTRASITSIVVQYEVIVQSWLSVREEMQTVDVDLAERTISAKTL